MELWSAFACGEGDGGRGIGAWPEADVADGRLRTLVISDPLTVEQFDIARCERWQDVYEAR